MNVEGNTILITGGSSGIGLALVKRFLEFKNKIIITGRDETRLKNIKHNFPEIEIFKCDLADNNSLNDLVLFIEQQHADVNILVNNAAIQYNYLFTDEPGLPYKIDYEIAVNLAAPIKLTSLLLPVLIKNKYGAVVNVSSGLAITPKRTASVYCATKSGIHSFSKSLRYQLQDRGINVFEIIPPLVDTPMTEGRGKSKITPDKLVDEFFKSFKANKYESYIGKSKYLKLINRLSPQLADIIMKNG